MQRSNPEELLKIFSKISQTLNSSLNPQEVLSNAMESVIELVKAERGLIMLVDNGKLSFPVARNLDEEGINKGVEFSKNMVKKVIEEGRPILTMDAKMDERFSHESSVIAYGLRSVLLVPLKIKDRTIGAIYVDNRAKTGCFDEQDKELLTMFANQAAVAIENARLYDSLKKSIDARFKLQKKIHQEETQRIILEETNKVKEELVHYIFHDLKNLLTIVINSLKIFQKQINEELENSAAKLLDTAMKTSDSSLEMTNKILDVYKFESGSMPLEIDVFIVNPVIETLLENSNILVSENVKLKFSSENDENYRVKADKSLVKRILHNLLSNACRFTREGFIEVKLSKNDEKSVKVEVIDTGPGIPDKYHEVIFDKFKQVETKREGTSYNTGLGLTFCKLAVESQNGRIGLESQVGQGSNFFFTLPSA